MIDAAPSIATIMHMGVLVTIGTVQCVLETPNFFSHARRETMFKMGGMMNVITNPTRPTYCKTRD
jgi:hypothetical protein